MQTKFRVEQIFDKFKQQQKFKYSEMLTSLMEGFGDDVFDPIFKDW